MIKPNKLNKDAIIAWMFIFECHMEYGSLKKGGVIDLAYNLMKSYQDEFHAVEMVYSGITATRKSNVAKKGGKHGL